MYFNEPMQRASLVAAGTFTLRRLPAGVALGGWSASCGDVTCQIITYSRSGLLSNATYEAKIATTALDAEGNPLATDYVWTFIVGPPPADDLEP